MLSIVFHSRWLPSGAICALQRILESPWAAYSHPAGPVDAYVSEPRVRDGEVRMSSLRTCFPVTLFNVFRFVFVAANKPFSLNPTYIDPTTCRLRHLRQLELPSACPLLLPPGSSILPHRPPPPLPRRRRPPWTPTPFHYHPSGRPESSWMRSVSSWRVGRISQTTTGGKNVWDSWLGWPLGVGGGCWGGNGPRAAGCSRPEREWILQYMYRIVCVLMRL